MTELTEKWVFSRLPRRRAESDKNDYGRVLCICGSRSYAGAAYFAAQAAVRMGSGVVTLALPQSLWPILAAKLNEPVLRPMPEDADGFFSHDAFAPLLALADRADAVLLGCGLGLSPQIEELVEALLCRISRPLILDADGINAIAAHTTVLRARTAPTVLTPHRREFFRLSSLERPTDAELSDFAAQNGCTLLYKRHRTGIFAPDGQCYCNTTGNAGMAKGGSGDVLAGMLLALLGQRLSPVDAACCAAFLHGQAGDLAATRLSQTAMTPTDLIAQLPEITRPLDCG